MVRKVASTEPLVCRGPQTLSTGSRTRYTGLLVKPRKIILERKNWSQRRGFKVTPARCSLLWSGDSLVGDIGHHRHFLDIVVIELSHLA